MITMFYVKKFQAALSTCEDGTVVLDASFANSFGGPKRIRHKKAKKMATLIVSSILGPYLKETMRNVED